MASKKKLGLPEDKEQKEQLEKGARRVLTKAEASRYLKISRSAVSKLIKRERLTLVTFLRASLGITREDLDEYLKSKSKGGRPRKKTKTHC